MIEYWKPAAVVLVAAAAFVVILSIPSCSRDRLLDMPDLRIDRIKGEPEIRVLLHDSKDSIVVDYWWGGDTRRRVKKKYWVDGDKLMRGKEPCFDKIFIIDPYDLKFTMTKENGKSTTYRGRLHMEAKQGRLVAINYLPFEDYLAGVLGSEMPLNWPPEALRAQAIAARTYALCRMLQKDKDDYDVVPSVDDQVYKGTYNEDARARKIINNTRGYVLAYNNELFHAYFHSTCGGKTVAASAAFPWVHTDILPTSGGNCNWCAESPRCRWTAEIPVADVQNLKNVPKNVTVTGLEAHGTDDAGRTHRFHIKNSSGADVLMKAHNFRMAVGASKLFSTKIDSIEKKGDKFIIKGRGWGHGVGMCQWGARGMAKAEFDAVAILEHYYPGAQIVRLYK